jgi:hypothetical protein
VNLISREEASAAGLKKYFTGEPCKHGHVSEKRVATKQCSTCAVAVNKAWKRRNPVRAAACHAAWKRRNPDKVAEYRATGEKRNPGRVAAYDKAWRERNPERAAECNASWRKRNPAKMAEYGVARHCARLRRTPSWADREAIIAVFVEARRLAAETGIPHAVDHVIPLQGKLVSGLHVHTNLRAIPAADNRRKHNKFQVAA